jgi:hypothetical protein
MPYSIPTSVERRLLRAGAKKASTWGAAVAVAAGGELRIKGISGLKHDRDYSPGEYANTPFVATGVLTDIKPPDVALSGDLFYDHGMLGTLIALLFGTAGAPSGPTDTSAYTHTFQWADLATGFATLIAEFPGIIYEVASWKPMELGLKVGGGRIQFDLKGRGNTMIDSSVVNGATQSGLLSFGGQDTPVLFNHASVKMNAQSGADVAAATALVVSGLQATFKRAIDAIHGAGSPAIIEPKENGFPEIKLKLDFPRYATDNTALQAAMIAGTLQKVLITMTSPLLAGSASAYYSIKLYFPNLRIVQQDAPWDEIVKNGIELVAEQAATAPTGMSYTRPYAVIVNKQTTDYLA